MKTPFIITESNITVYLPEQIVNYNKNQPEYSKIIELISSNDEEGLISLLTKGAFEIPEYSGGKFKINKKGEVLDIETGTTLDNTLAKKLIEFAEQGLPFEPLLMFHHKVIDNPNKESALDLFRFLDKNKIPLTEDGNFLAYKKVTRNDEGKLFDTHTGTVPNEVGMQPTMERKKVDANRRNQCSYGYHVCGFDYLNSFSGNVILEVEVDPRDVVTVPEDYNHTKMRVCSYLILCERKANGERTESLVKVNKKDLVKNAHEKTPVKPEDQQVKIESTIEGIDLKAMTAQQIKDYIKEKYDVEILSDNKNKQGIIKKAHKIIFG